MRPDSPSPAGADASIVWAREPRDGVRDMLGARRLVVGVLGAVAALPFLAIIWYAMNMVMVGLFIVDDPGLLASGIYYIASASLLALDVWIGYEASKMAR